MANKRVSELVQITATELAPDDLLLVSDVTAQESKKLSLSDLNTYFGNTKNSGSFYGTASWATLALYALNGPQPLTASYSYTSSWALNAISSSQATSTLSASYSATSSFVISASYALTSSIQLIYSSAFSDYAKSASYLIYTPTLPNGTASFAISTSFTLGTSSYAVSSSFATVALYALNATGSSAALTAISSSWASASYHSIYSTQSISASYLIYQEGKSNGTASYALVAGTYPNFRINWGIYNAISQSTYSAQLDNVIIDPQVLSGPQSSSFEVVGTVYVPLINSNTITASLELIALNRWSGITTSLDKTPLDLLSPTSGAGAVYIPFTLMNEVPLTGSYMIYVTASCSDINYVPQIVSSRIPKFNISSLSDNVSVRVAETMSFVASNEGISPTLTYSSSLAGTVQSGTDAQIVSAGIENITDIDASATNITIIKYAWTLYNLKNINVSSNPLLTDIGGMPNSIVSMSLQNAGITSLAPLNYTSVSYLNCSYNNLVELPLLPATMTYINCGYNSQIVLLPESLPNGLTYLNASNTAISYPPNSMPNSIITIDVSNNLALTQWNTSFPTSLVTFDAHNTSLSAIPTLPSGALYVDVSSCLMTALAMDNICAQLVTNGLNNGYLSIIGNGTYLPTTAARISTLMGRGWTVVS